MWRFIQGVDEPQAKKPKTNEERLETQREYEKDRRQRQFQSSWAKEYPWLRYSVEKGTMTCSTCVRHSKEGVFVSGCTNLKLQAVKKHSISESHRRAEGIEKAATASSEKSIAASSISMLNTAALDKLKILFANAHFIAKNGRPYTDYVKMCVLDKTNKGLAVGDTYITDKYCQIFVGSIAKSIQNIQDGHIKNSPFMSVISDGSTDAAAKETECVILRTSVHGTVHTHFIGVKHVPKADSDHISQAIIGVLSDRFGDTWKGKLVAMGCDGASVMVGEKTGVVQKLKEYSGQSHIFKIHCSAHRLELAYKDAKKAIDESTKVHMKVETLLLNLYLFYKCSPLNRANLEASFRTLNKKAKVPTRVGGTRWLPHMKRALTTIIYGEEAIVQHLEQMQNPCDGAHRKDSAAKAKNFLRLLKDSSVRVWLHFLLDVVSCLSAVSEGIQAENSTLADVWNELQSAKAIIKKYMVSDGRYLSKVDSSGVVETGRRRFLQAVLDSIDKRFHGDLHLFKGSSFIAFKNWPVVVDGDDLVHSRKRRRTSDNIDIEDRLESLIARVGEKSTSSLESNLEGLASVLEADLPNYKNKIMRILCECVVTLPEKQCVYTTLVGLLNAKNYNFGGEFVEMLVRHLKEALKTEAFEAARMIVRFVSDLVNCRVIVAGSLLAMFDNFIEVTLEDNIPQVRSDWYVYAVLSALPWVGRELFEKKEVEFQKVLVTIDNYVSKRQKIHVPALRVWSSNIPHPQEEYLDCLWSQIKNLRNNKWMEKQVPRPYLAFDSVLCDALQHTLPQIIPPSHNEEIMYPLPSVVYRMFDYTDVPEGPAIPGSHAIERFLIEEQLSHIISTHHKERKDCAAQLLSFTTKNKIPLNYMIVEVMFSQLFRLPQPPYLEIFYGSTLIELCKLQPGSMPQVLAQATEMLYERLDTMKTTCIERLANWFSYHLSNFQFRWSWDDWIACTQVNPLLPKPRFVAEVLHKCLRLSYHQRIKDSVPETFQELVPLKPQARYKYEEEGAGSLPGTMVAHQLIEAIRSKCIPEDTIVLLKDLPNPLADDTDEPSHNPLHIDTFVSTLFHLGSKSFSHSFAAIAKFHTVLKMLAESEEGQICLLKTMYEVWLSHPQMLVVLTDKLLKTQIVECSAVANWLFSADMAPDFTKNYVWEIMHSTIQKMSKHVEKLQKEAEEARDLLDAAKRKMADGLDPDDDGDVPSEEMVERMEERLELIQNRQKRLFLIIFQRFIIILTDHLAKCEGEGIDYQTPWYKWVIERLQEVFLLHHNLVFKYINTLESLLFTSDIDIHILEVFQQFCALRS